MTRVGLKLLVMLSTTWLYFGLMAVVGCMVVATQVLIPKTWICDAAEQFGWKGTEEEYEDEGDYEQKLHSTTNKNSKLNMISGFTVSFCHNNMLCEDHSSLHPATSHEPETTQLQLVPLTDNSKELAVSRSEGNNDILLESKRQQIRCNWATKSAGVSDQRQGSNSKSVVELTNGSSEDTKEQSDSDTPENNSQYTTVYVGNLGLEVRPLNPKIYLYETSLEQLRAESCNKLKVKS
ncbi:unnamed protein product [Lactuca saligna]|uniref:Uncharacterized protein n=1 Tax=Lactuca saligna TaxID=75948 RepID=A0AA35VL56_LACSI|nr:unnamed protein product [Lactuca saligna]